MNAKPNINQKSKSILPAPAAGGCQLQHIKTLLGLSRRRCSMGEVLALIGSRQIPWAWDIARKGSGRQEIRIWRESLMACLERENGSGEGPPADKRSLDQIIEIILPRPASLARRAATLSGRELQIRFLCSCGHIAGLIADGELCRVGPARPGVTPEILYQSAFEFLKRRPISI